MYLTSPGLLSLKLMGTDNNAVGSPSAVPAARATAAREEYSDLQRSTRNDDADLSAHPHEPHCSQVLKQDADCTRECARGMPDFLHEGCEAGVYLTECVCKDDPVLTHLK